MLQLLSAVWAPLWAFIAPYITPLMAALAGERYRAQLDRIKELEAENEQKQAALALGHIDSGPVLGAADRLRASKWNRKQP